MMNHEDTFMPGANGFCTLTALLQESLESSLFAVLVWIFLGQSDLGRWSEVG